MRSISASLLLLLVACAPAAKGVTIDNKVTVVITPRPDRMPFDPRSARLSAATDQLAEAAGHPIAIDVDAAMVPEFKSSFEEALGKSFEEMALDLKELKRESPDAFAWGVPQVEHVSLRYDATLTRDDVTFDASAHAIRVKGPARRDSLVPAGTLYGPIAQAYSDFVRGRYANMRPSQVPVAERRTYFSALTGGLPRSSRNRPKESSNLADAPEAKLILDIFELRGLPGNDASLLKSIDGWLHGRADFFRDAYINRADVVRQLPPSCAFHAAEAAYAKWMLDVFRAPETTEPQRLEIEKEIYVVSYTSERERQDGRTHPSWAWPTIDRFAFGLSVVDDWRKAAHPTPITQPRVTPSQAFIVCPKGEPHTSYGGLDCKEDFYRFAVESPGGPKRLVSALVERNDPEFATVTFYAIHGQPDQLALLRALEPSPVVWSAGMRRLTDAIHNDGNRDLLEESQRIWLERPAYRPLVLRLLAHMDIYDHGNVPWREFAESYGQKASRSDLDAYLHEGSDAMGHLPLVWPALDRGYSRAEIIIPKLDAFLADKARNESHNNASPHDTLRGIIARMCAEKNTADLAAMRNYLLQRVSAHPGESFASIADSAKDRECQPAPPPPPARNEVRLVPGKQRLKIIQSGAEPSRDKFL